MESGVAVPEKEAEAVDVDLSSSSPTLFLNRGPQKWWWKREVGYSILFIFIPEVVLLGHFSHGLSLFHTGGYENERDAPSDGPSPIINIKKEKRETEEETKEILRNLERDNVSHGPFWWNSVFKDFWKFNSAVSFVQFIDDPFLRSEQKSCPVQLPLALSGWGFRDEFSTSALKSEKVEDNDEPMETAVEGNSKLLL